MFPSTLSTRLHVTTINHIHYRLLFGESECKKSDRFSNIRGRIFFLFRSRFTISEIGGEELINLQVQRPLDVTVYSGGFLFFLLHSDGENEKSLERCRF